MKYTFLLIMQFITMFCLAQKAEVYGKIIDNNGNPFNPSVNIAVKDLAGGTTTDSKGMYRIIVPANKTIVIQYSHVSVKSEYKTLNLKQGQRIEINMILDESKGLDTFNVISKRASYDGIIHINPIKIEAIPSPNGDPISTFVKSIPGVHSNNELSSQYSVRGGNFDENLVYVNGIEVQRPMLIKAGQQEGLSFANGDLISKIQFSAGGFSAFYGDKMSSVMDVEYKKPKEFAGSASASLLGASLHLEGTSVKQRLTYLFGLRYKTNQYMLKSLDISGSYKPSFTDFQTFITYDITESWELSFLGNYAINNYKIVPETRETNFGTLFEPLRFTVYFDGQEIDKFQNYMGALNLKYKYNNTKLNFTSSIYRTSESETYDIMGQYFIDVLDVNSSNNNAPQITGNEGVGTYLNHARNYLNGLVTSLQHRGQYKNWQWGADLRHDIIDDNLSEWKMIDSAGYNLPHSPDNIGQTISTYDRPNIVLNNVVRSKQLVVSNRYSTYIMHDWSFRKTDTSSIYKLNIGLRTNYWDFSKEFLLSPRLSLTLTPANSKNITYRFAAGIYSQPPFYKEMRYLDGTINYNIKAQKSSHIVIGSDLLFEAWDRPFKFTTEAYYKYMWDLIPYEMEDVRLRYFAENNAVGYATGIDFKLNGDLVKGTESWVGLSLMKTQEDIKGDYYYNRYNSDGELIKAGFTKNNIAVDSTKITPGFIPRPTDQRFSFNVFFQDFIPGYPTYKVHLNLVYASGLPYGPPTHLRYQQIGRYPAYKRVDVGFSKQLVSEDSQFKAKSPLRFLKSVWVSIEVFNLLQIDNTLSYIWVSDINGNYHSVPNYLTSRQLNFKIMVKF